MRKVHDLISADRQYWQRLREDWLENEDRDGGLPFLSLFQAPRREREYLMTPEEHAALAKLPDPATLYRGITFYPEDPLRHAVGLSWTDDLDIAAYFAHPSGWRDGLILTALVPKNRMLAYFKGRGENEVVINPRGILYQKYDTPIEVALERAAEGQQRLEDYVDAVLKAEREKRG